MIDISFRIVYVARAHCIPTRRGRPHPSQTDKAIAHGLSSYRSKFTLIKAQFFVLNTADERGTSDETEANTPTSREG